MQDAPLKLESPAKINLMLDIHGRREDGFHELTSVIVALGFGDTLELTRADGPDHHLRCDRPGLPLGADNLILRAAGLYAARNGLSRGFEFTLTKRIPVGAGLGGGSSNAATALIGMNRLCGEPMTTDELEAMAAAIGSDCPFFVQARPAVMRGRGEVLEALEDAQAAALRGLPVVLFRPEFGIETAWAYAHMAALGSDYTPVAESTARLARFARERTPKVLLHNSMEQTIGRKYLAITCVLERLSCLGVECLMSGSGSCCFALPDPAKPEIDALRATLKDCWGSRVFCIETVIR